MHPHPFSALATASLALLCLAAPARATLVNMDFSDGLNGWSTGGNVSLIPGATPGGGTALHISTTGEAVPWSQWGSQMPSTMTHYSPGASGGAWAYQIIDVQETGWLTVKSRGLTDNDGEAALVFAMVSLINTSYRTSTGPHNYNNNSITGPGEFGYDASNAWRTTNISLPYFGPTAVVFSLLSYGTPGANAVIIGDLTFTPATFSNSPHVKAPDEAYTGGLLLLGLVGLGTCARLRHGKSVAPLLYPPRTGGVTR